MHTCIRKGGAVVSEYRCNPFLFTLFTIHLKRQKLTFISKLLFFLAVPVALYLELRYSCLREREKTSFGRLIFNFRQNIKILGNSEIYTF